MNCILSTSLASRARKRPRSRARRTPNPRARPKTRATPHGRTTSARSARPQSPSRASPHPLPFPQPLRPTQCARAARRTLTARRRGSSRRAGPRLSRREGSPRLGGQGASRSTVLAPAPSPGLAERRIRHRRKREWEKKSAAEEDRLAPVAATGIVRFGARLWSCASSSAAVSSMYAPCVRAQPSAWMRIARRLLSYSRR
jgi:hypothetical protein